MERLSRGRRIYLALKILRAWNNGTAGYDSSVVITVNDWIYAGMKGPIPWPSGEFFSQWASENGMEEKNGFVGVRFISIKTEGRITDRVLT